MPTYIYTDNDDEIVPLMPAWGTLPLDIYLLEEWDTASTSPETETDHECRRRLVRQFLDLGVLGREQYYLRAKSAPLTPTTDQIQTILRPLRPDSLRRYAAYSGSEEEGLWVRTCYDADKEEAHESFWEEFVAQHDTVGYHSLIIDDPEVFTEPVDILDIFPERVTNNWNVENVQERREALAEILDREKEIEDDNDDETAEWRRRVEMGPMAWATLYIRYHVACAVSYFLEEDSVALEERRIKLVLMDDCGAVVHWARMDALCSDSFDAQWYGGHWKEGFWDYAPGDVGGTYLPGGRRGPPYVGDYIGRT